MAESNEHYDAIVIGSGIGGLTTASLLSQIEHKQVTLAKPIHAHWQPAPYRFGCRILWYCWLDDVGRTRHCGGDEPAVEGDEHDFASHEVQ